LRGIPGCYDAPVLANTISIGEVTDLGGGEFRVRLTTGTPENTVSQTQTVKADSRDTAIIIATEAFQRYLRKIGHVLARVSFANDKPN
jgi:hypothetical protein